MSYHKNKYSANLRDLACGIRQLEVEVEVDASLSSEYSLVVIPFVSMETDEIFNPLLLKAEFKWLAVEDEEDDEEEGGREEEEDRLGGWNDVNTVNKSDLARPLFNITTAYPPAPAPHNDKPIMEIMYNI